MIEAVISGGQTGADRGGLEAAFAAGIQAGGFVPAGRRAEDGVVPDRYLMTEVPHSDYRVRTMLNIRSSDATVIFVWGGLSGGSRVTRKGCLEAAKPHLVVDLATVTDDVAAAAVFDWLVGKPWRVLNVAGKRESRAPGIQGRVQAILTGVFRQLKEAQ